MSEIISLDHANRILATFGINRPTQKYERWVKSYGFDLKDFDEVLFESEYVFTHDWRGVLEDTLTDIEGPLSNLGSPISFELDEDGAEGKVFCGNQSTPVAYRPSEDHDFADVVAALQSIVSNSVEFRGSPTNVGSSSWTYAILTSDEWAEIETYASEVISKFFIPITDARQP